MERESASNLFARNTYLSARKQFETIEINIKQDTGESVPCEVSEVLLTLHFRQSRPVNLMKKLYTPNHKLYEEYYLNQAKQKCGNLPAFHSARFQRGYGLGSIFKGLFRWALPHVQQGAKMLGKKALQTGVDVAQDVLAGENPKTATKKRAKQALGLSSQDSPQSGAGKRATKRKARLRKNSSPAGKRAKASPQQKKKPEEKYSFLK